MDGIANIVNKIDDLVASVDKITTQQYQQILRFFEMKELREKLTQFFQTILYQKLYAETIIIGRLL